MANNYAQATMVPDVVLNEELKAVLKASGADWEDGDKPGTSYVFWEENIQTSLETEWLEMEELDEKLIEKWGDHDLAELLLEVLKLNPEVPEIHVQAAWTCSKMRPDEFGGFGLYVTRKQWGYIGSDLMWAQPDGTIKHRVEIHDWPEAA